MNPGDPLASLRDIHLPAPVSAWPPAPGWWVLAALLLGVGLIAGWVWRRWRRRRYRRAAVRALKISYAAYQSSGQSGGDASDYLRDASRILKQAALAGFPRDRVAALHGEAWPVFLVESGGDAALQGPVGELLAAVYRPSVEADPEQVRQLQRLLEEWLRSHRC